MAEQKQKLSGMEMAMQSLLRVAGFDAGEVTKQISFVVGEMQGGLKATVDTMQAIQREQLAQRALLEHIMRELKIPPLDASIAAPPVALLNGQIHSPEN